MSSLSSALRPCPELQRTPPYSTAGFQLILFETKALIWPSLSKVLTRWLYLPVWYCERLLSPCSQGHCNLCGSLSSPAAFYRSFGTYLPCLALILSLSLSSIILISMLPEYFLRWSSPYLALIHPPCPVNLIRLISSCPVVSGKIVLPTGLVGYLILDSLLVLNSVHPLTCLKYLNWDPVGPVKPCKNFPYLLGTCTSCLTFCRGLLSTARTPAKLSFCEKRVFFWGILIRTDPPIVLQ